MATIDIVAYQDPEGNNIAVAKTQRGINWLLTINLGSGKSFLEFLGSIPESLQVAVLCPDMRTIKIVSTPLH